MSMEMAVVSFDGTHTAEQKLSSLRASRDDAWLVEVGCSSTIAAAGSR